MMTDDSLKPTKHNYDRLILMVGDSISRCYSNTMHRYDSAFTISERMLSGCNFSLLLLSLSWRSFTILKNQEFRTFLLYTIFLGIGIGLVLFFGCHKSFGSSFRESFFSVISAFTTTGFFVSDYMTWPTFLWVILFLLMFIGACSGSTSGGVKIFRHLIFIKNSILELKRIIHPNAVLPVKVNGKAISAATTALHFAPISLVAYALRSFPSVPSLVPKSMCCIRDKA